MVARDWLGKRHVVLQVADIWSALFRDHAMVMQLDDTLAPLYLAHISKYRTSSHTVTKHPNDVMCVELRLPERRTWLTVRGQGPQCPACRLRQLTFDMRVIYLLRIGIPRHGDMARPGAR